MHSSTPPNQGHTPPAVEWPSVILAISIHAGWLASTACANRLAWWLTMPIGAWLVAWHMSLQHEVIHGHPTRWRRINDLIGSVPFSLWLPFQRYKETHLGHHRGSHLTDPIDDPESHYVTPAAYSRSGPIGRALMQANNTLLGRVTLGPGLGILGFLRKEVCLMIGGRTDLCRIWLRHLVAVAAVVAWLSLVCHLSLARYFALFVYPGYALALVRSFAEHRAADEVEHRTAIVEHAPILGMLFLYNNLHVVHHLKPGLSWYRIPAFYRQNKAAILRINGGLIYHGYRDVARRYLFRQHDQLIHSRLY